MSVIRVTIAAFLISAVAFGADPSERVQLCGSSIGNLFENPKCNVIACSNNWPRGRMVHHLSRVLCNGQKKLQDLMDMCCIESADEMQSMIEQVVATSGAPVRASVPRVPNVLRSKVQQKHDFDDSIFSY